MRKLLSVIAIVLAVLVVASVPVSAQVKNNGESILTHVGGVYVADNYTFWSLNVDGGPVTSASPATMTLRQGSAALPDGKTIIPFVGQIVNIGAGTNQEAVTLTAVNNCYKGAPYDSCTISGNTTKTHGQGELVTTGSSGILEASADAANRSGGSVYFEVDCGQITLSTSGATTTTTCLVPKTFTNLGASVYVNTTVTTSASYSLGIASATTAWVTSCTALTAATTCSQFVNAPAKTAQGAGTGALLVTANATAGAGVIHPKVWGYIGVQSNH